MWESRSDVNLHHPQTTTAGDTSFNVKSIYRCIYNSLSSQTVVLAMNMAKYYNSMDYILNRWKLDGIKGLGSSDFVRKPPLMQKLFITNYGVVKIVYYKLWCCNQEFWNPFHGEALNLPFIFFLFFFFFFSYKSANIRIWRFGLVTW